jgi:hypothetical protein
MYTVWYGRIAQVASRGIGVAEIIADGDDIAWLVDYARQQAASLPSTHAIYITVYNNEDEQPEVCDIPVVMFRGVYI